MATRSGRLLWQAALAGFLLLVGFLAVTQWRVGRTIRQQAELPTLRVRDLAVLVEQQEAALRTLEGEVASLRRRLLEYETAAAQGRGAADALAREAAFLRVVLGLTPVQGPGVIVRLREQRPAAAPTAAVQAQDLSGLVNELWSAGAEAVAINGIRILATTGFRQDDQGIAAGTARLRPPFQIQAVGDADAMIAALNLRGGFVEGLRSVGLVVDVAKAGRLTLPAYRGPLGFRQAAPAP